ncbi:beta-1,6-N-acetylglucosaminyltransferase [Bifidobacterium breve]|uniref:beta-1,6-N-acetylglucosaminyltransferase n=1 Tax=Bifidobacterium breve TaxID=1685 RepID=UPI003BF941FD
MGKGAQWFSITDNLARYVVDNWSWCKQIFAHSFCSDEMFLQTIILNSSYRENIYHPQADDDYRAIMRLIQWNQGDLTTFRTKDYQELIYSPMIFAWKFNENIDEEIINLIAERIRG